MKAIIATSYGPPEVLQFQEIQKPTPKANEILIKVHTTTVNAGDCRMRSFTVPPIFWLPGRLALGITKLRNPILGMEIAGVVEAIGQDVTRFKVGDQVFGSTFATQFGGYAEYKCLPEDGSVALKPANISYEDAATLSVGAITALSFLKRGKLQPGQHILIYGASGSVGTFAIQLAKYFGAEVTAVCSSANAALVASLGAEHVIDYTKEDFRKNGVVYDVLFDTVGKTSLSACQNSLKPGGYYLQAVMAGAELEAWWSSFTTGRKAIGGTAYANIDELTFLTQLIALGKLKPVIDRCYSFEQIVEAHRYVDRGRKRGNVVINVA